MAPPLKIGLRSLQIGALVALNKTQEISEKFNALKKVVSNQPEDFIVDWVFNGVRHFIMQNQKLAPYQEWLDSLFHALEGENRDVIITNLGDVEKNFTGQDN
jgi:hypothetical protein